MQAIVDLPGENYLLDLEAATVDLTLHYKMAEHWALYGIISAISYQDGFLDSTIEQFHDTFGFSTFAARGGPQPGDPDLRPEERPHRVL
jgi:hypothetical protein